MEKILQHVPLKDKVMSTHEHLVQQQFQEQPGEEQVTDNVSYVVDRVSVIAQEIESLTTEEPTADQ